MALDLNNQKILCLPQFINNWVFGPLKVLVPKAPEGPGIKKSRDLTSPKVPGLENRKSPGTIETQFGTQPGPPW